jgi:hypothetical protein
MFAKDGGTGFTTASAPENAKGAFVAVRFNPQASAADITKFLTDNKASLVGGPVAGGLFKLRMSDSAMSEDQLSTVVKNISANPVIGFAAKAN